MFKKRKLAINRNKKYKWVINRILTFYTHSCALCHDLYAFSMRMIISVSRFSMTIERVHFRDVLSLNSTLVSCKSKARCPANNLTYLPKVEIRDLRLCDWQLFFIVCALVKESALNFFQRAIDVLFAVIAKCHLILNRYLLLLTKRIFYAFISA